MDLALQCFRTANSAERWIRVGCPLIVLHCSSDNHFSEQDYEWSLDRSRNSLGRCFRIVSTNPSYRKWILILVASVLYRLMQKEIKQLRESPDVEDELAAEALEEAEEGAPLLRNISSDSVDT